MHDLHNVYALFDVSPVTLWRWCRRAHITPHQDPADYRRRYLDDGQLIQLARLHNRVIFADPDAALLSEIEQLKARIAKLERRS